MSEVEDYRSMASSNCTALEFAVMSFLLEVGREIDEDIYKEILARAKQLPGLQNRINIAMRQYEARHPQE